MIFYVDNEDDHEEDDENVERREENKFPCCPPAAILISTPYNPNPLKLPKRLSKVNPAGSILPRLPILSVLSFKKKRKFK